MTIEELRIEKIAMGGMGIAFHDGRAIFIPQCLVGDVVRAEITHMKKDHAFARVLHYHSRGEGHVAGLCDAFDKNPPCGGCDWLMASYPKQLEYKDMLIRELFHEHKNKILDFEPSPSQTGYRNKVFMPYSREGYGIFAAYSHEIVTHEQCLNQPELFDLILKELQRLLKKAGVESYDEVSLKGNLRHIGLRANHDLSEILLILVTKSARLPFSKTIAEGITKNFPQIVGVVQNINRERTNIILGQEDKLLFGRDYLHEELQGLHFRLNYQSFWQINGGTMRKILDFITQEIGKDDKILDAFCGIGAIGLSLADRVHSVFGIEELPAAIEDARITARENGITNASFETGLFETLFEKVNSEFMPNTLILDPPRGGVKKEVLNSICESEIEKIIYLSCSLPNLKRDMDILLKIGNYHLSKIKGFDMFPNTWHTETLAIFEKE